MLKEPAYREKRRFEYEFGFGDRWEICDYTFWDASWGLISLCALTMRGQYVAEICWGGPGGGGRWDEVSWRRRVERRDWIRSKGKERGRCGGWIEEWEGEGLAVGTIE